jgi:hypothetical protein
LPFPQRRIEWWRLGYKEIAVKDEAGKERASKDGMEDERSKE